MAVSALTFSGSPVLYDASRKTSAAPTSLYSKIASGLMGVAPVSEYLTKTVPNAMSVCTAKSPTNAKTLLLRVCDAVRSFIVNYWSSAARVGGRQSTQQTPQAGQHSGSLGSWRRGGLPGKEPGNKTTSILGGSRWPAPTRPTQGRFPQSAARMVNPSSPGMVSGGPTPTAEKLKSEANELYRRGKMGAAIDLYTECHCLCPQWVVPLVNRALCHRKAENWCRVIDDCNKALAIDASSMKAYYYLGQAYMGTGDNDMAQKALKRALELARETESSIKEEVWRALARAKYEAHCIHAAERNAQRLQLQTKLQAALKSQAQQRLDNLVAGGTGWHETEKDVADDLRTSLEHLDAMFARDAHRDNGTEPPSWATCQLTLEVFHEPVLTPSGISYEHAAMEEHLRKVGNFDPVTRAPMTAKDLRRNVGLRSAIEHYLEENPWAWSYAM